MTIEEIKSQLEELIRDRQSFVDEDEGVEWNEVWLRDIEALKFAVKAVEKQIPKKMSIKISDYMIKGYLYRDKCGYCPNCGEFRGNLDYQPHKIIKYKFCPDCGQALDWGW